MCVGLWYMNVPKWKETNGGTKLVEPRWEAGRYKFDIIPGYTYDIDIYMQTRYDIETSRFDEWFKARANRVTLFSRGRNGQMTFPLDFCCQTRLVAMEWHVSAVGRYCIAVKIRTSEKEKVWFHFAVKGNVLPCNFTLLNARTNKDASPLLIATLFAL